MKKLNILFLLVVALGVAIGCSKDDKADTSPLQGKWVYDTYTYTDSEGTTVPQLAYEPACPDKKYFEFKSAGVLEFGIANPSTQAVNPCKFYKYTGSWKLKDSTLSTTVEGDTKDLVLISVTATDLVFKYPQPNDEYYTFTLKKS